MGSAHGLAVLLSSLAAVLAFTDWAQSVVPAHGLLRTVLAAYLVINAVALEFYIVTRIFIFRRDWHLTALIASYQLNEALFRAIAFINIGLPVLALFAGVFDRGWLFSLVAIGIFQFFLIFNFPHREREGEWTEADIIRFYAQESARYLARLRLMQYVYALANFASTVVAVSLIVVVITLLGGVAYDAFLSSAAPTEATLTQSFNQGLLDVARFARALPVYVMAFAAITIIFSLAGMFWDWSHRRHRPIRPHLEQTAKAQEQS
jgi:hypothetical protein